MGHRRVAAPRVEDRHHLGRSTPGTDGKATADDLAHRHEVRLQAVPALQATDAQPQRDHLVDDQQDLPAPRLGPHEVGERLRHRPQASPVRHQVDDHGRDPVAISIERRRERRGVGDRDRADVAARGPGQARGLVGQGGVVDAVVAPVEPQQQIAPGERSRRADGHHDRLGARVREAQALDRRHALRDPLGEGDVVARRQAEARPLVHRRRRGGHDDRMAVAVHERRVVVLEVDHLVAVLVDQAAPLASRRVRRHRRDVERRARVAAGHGRDGAGVQVSRGHVDQHRC